MKHPHAEIIKALVDDDSLTLWFAGKNWTKYEEEEGSKIWFVVKYPSLKYHLGPTPPPRMIETPYGSYPEPLREAPTVGTDYYYFGSGGKVHFAGKWLDSDYEKEWLSLGLLHLTEDAAYAQAQVELKRRMAELGWEKS